MDRRTQDRRGTGRSYLLAGAAAGIILAAVFGAQAKTTFKQMVAGAPATAADVNQAHQDLATALDNLEAELAKLEAVPDCPTGYTRDMTATGITLCKRGADEMVKAGSFWIDRYEMSIMDAGRYKGGLCDGTGKIYGRSNLDDYPASFPDEGKITAPLYACSIKGLTPSANMTDFQASMACALSGKRLCSNYQWQVAAMGTPDDSTSCNITKPGSIEAAGARPKCVSLWGAYDMVGNLWERVAWWSQAGKISSSFTSGATATPWGAAFGDGMDATWNINGTTRTENSYYFGHPAAALRGGGGGQWGVGANAGVYALHLNNSPAFRGSDVTARCCR